LSFSSLGSCLAAGGFFFFSFSSFEKWKVGLLSSSLLQKINDFPLRLPGPFPPRVQSHTSPLMTERMAVVNFPLRIGRGKAWVSQSLLSLCNFIFPFPAPLRGFLVGIGKLSLRERYGKCHPLLFSLHLGTPSLSPRLRASTATIFPLYLRRRGQLSFSE